MNKFKAGDKVRCIDSVGWKVLEEGKTYKVTTTVRSRGVRYIRLEGLTKINFHPNRFELVRSSVLVSSRKLFL